MSGSFLYKKLSQYEGEKRLDQKAEAIAEGRLAPRIRLMQEDRPEPVTSYFCQVCKQNKRNFRLVRTHLRGMGERIQVRRKGMGRKREYMQGYYIRACESCAAAIERPVGEARVASGESA